MNSYVALSLYWPDQNIL